MLFVCMPVFISGTSGLVLDCRFILNVLELQPAGQGNFSGVRYFSVPTMKYLKYYKCDLSGL